MDVLSPIHITLGDSAAAGGGGVNSGSHTVSMDGSRRELQADPLGASIDFTPFREKLHLYSSHPESPTCVTLSHIPTWVRGLEVSYSRVNGLEQTRFIVKEIQRVLYRAVQMSKLPLDTGEFESVESVVDSIDDIVEVLENSCPPTSTKQLEIDMKFAERCAALKVHIDEATNILLGKCLDILSLEQHVSAARLTKFVEVGPSVIGLTCLCTVGLFSTNWSVPPVVYFAVNVVVLLVIFGFEALRKSDTIGVSPTIAVIMGLMSIAPPLLYVINVPVQFAVLVFPFFVKLLRIISNRPAQIVFCSVLFCSVVIALILEWDVLLIMALITMTIGACVEAIVIPWFCKKQVSPPLYTAEDVTILITALTNTDVSHKSTNSGSSRPNISFRAHLLNSSCTETAPVHRVMSTPISESKDSTLGLKTAEEDDHSDSSQESVISSKDVTKISGHAQSSPLQQTGSPKQFLAARLVLEDGQEYLFSMETIHVFLSICATTLDGTVIAWNNNMTTLTGYTDEHACGQPLSAFLTPNEAGITEGLLEAPQYLRTVTFQKKGVSTGVPVKFSSAFLYPLLSQSKPIGMVFVGVNAEAQAGQQNAGEWFTMLIQQQLENAKHFVEAGKSDDANKALRNSESLLARMKHVVTENFNSTITHVDLIQLQSKLISEHEIKPTSVSIDENLPESLPIDSGALLSAEQFIAHSVKRSKNHNADISIEFKRRQDIGGTFMEIFIVDTAPPFSRKKLQSLFYGCAESDMLHAGKRIQQAGGSFTIRSKRGVGTKISIELPFLGHEPDNTTPTLKTSMKPITDMQTPFCTLMLEPVEIYRNNLCQMLWKRRHAIQQADSVAQALAALDMTTVEILIVSIGTKNSRKRATDLLAAARNRNSGIQIVLTGGSIEADLLARCNAAGIEFLHLPFLPAELKKLMSKIEGNILKLRNENDVRKNITRIIGEKKNCPWVKGKLLGSGAAGDVYEATFELTGGVMAVKIIPLRTLGDDAVVPYLAEIELLAQLEHENIINYFYSTKTDTELQVFMEYASEGCLQNLLKVGPLDPPLAAAFIKDILKGLEYLHSQGIIHRDLKCANILLSSGYIAKVADFGCAVNLDKVRDGMAGTPSFMAPELLDGKRATTASDIWALGCTLWEMLSGHLPFPEYSGIVALTGYFGDPARTQSDVHSCVPSFGCAAATDFISQCLRLDPLQRPTCAALLNHEFLTLSKKEIVIDDLMDDSLPQHRSGVYDSKSLPQNPPMSPMIPRRQSAQAAPVKLVRRSIGSTGLSSAALNALEKAQSRKKSVNTFFQDSDESDDESIASEASVNTVNVRL